MEKIQKEKEYVLINRLYSGNYWNKNIGHESINLIRTDNGENYIYIQPYGTYNHSYNFKYVIQTRNINGHMLEILAIEKVDEGFIKNNQSKILPVNYPKNNTKKLKDYHNNQIKYIDAKKITYGGQYLYNIYKRNSGNDISLYISLKAEKVYTPKKDNRIFLIDQKGKTNISTNISHPNKNEHYITLNNITFPYTSQKTYILKNDLNELFNLLNEKENENENKPPLPKLSEIPFKQNKTNYLDIINQNDNELVYSNMFAYIFTNCPEFLQKFITKVTDGKVSDIKNPVVYREESNIDILIKTDTFYFVIENKIHSNINGLVYNEDKKLLKTDNKNKYISQLSKYYNDIDKLAKKENKKAYFCITTPDYNIINKDNYSHGDKYKLIKYSEIIEMLENLNIKDCYIQDFINSMKKHTYTDIKLFLQEQMLNRFKEKVNSLNNN